MLKLTNAFSVKYRTIPQKTVQNLMLAVVSVIKSYKINEDRPVRGLSRRRSSTRKFACRIIMVELRCGCVSYGRGLWGKLNK